MKKVIPYIIIVILCSLSITCSILSNRLHTKEKELLLQENARLEIYLNHAENEIYELNTELKCTEKSLSETAQALDLLAEQKANEKEINLNYVGEYTCTAYCCEKYPHICGGGGRTASGAPVTANVSVAVTDLKTFPYGTVIYIEDVGIRIVQDTGKFSKNKIDCAVDTHKHAANWEGQGKHRVYILEVADEQVDDD